MCRLESDLKEETDKSEQLALELEETKNTLTDLQTRIIDNA